MSKTKKAILMAAVKVFSSKGYDGATMDEVAIEGNVAKGTLYYHFKSKEELFNYTIIEGMKSLTDHLSEELDKSKDMMDKVRILIKTNLEMVYYNKDFFKVVISQFWGIEDRQKELRKLVNDYLSYISELLMEGMEKGIVPKADPYFLAHMFFGALSSVAIYEINNEGSLSFDEVTDKLVEYFLNTINFNKN